MVPWTLIASDLKRPCFLLKKCHQNNFRLKKDLYHWRKAQCYIPENLAWVKCELEPTARAAWSHYWTDAMAGAAFVSPAERRWRGTRWPGQHPEWSPQPRRRKALWELAIPLALWELEVLLALGWRFPLTDPERWTKSHCWARAWERECCTWEDRGQPSAWRFWCSRGGKQVRGRQTLGACWEGCCCNHGFPLPSKNIIYK